MVHNIRITFGAHTQPQIEIQQGDYNSRTIRARCYTSSGVLMEFEGETVSVVYEISGKISEEYPVEVLENVLTFTMPGISSASAGSGKLQLRIYGEKSLLHSAIIPYTVKASLDPGPAEEDQVPMLVLLVQQAQQAIAECTAATDKANETVADIEQKLADGAFIGPTGYQGIGVTSASLDDQGELVFTVTDPATGGSSTLPPVNIDTSAAIQSVNQAAQEGVKQVQAAQASAIAAVEQAGKTQITAAQNAGTQAVGDVTDAKNAAITDIGTAQSGAEAAITAAQESAVQTVQQSGTTAVGQVQKAQNTATTAIAQAQQNAITSVENEGDAQVQRLQEIVPQPTADNNGMVVAVQSGAYQLVNPARLVLNDGVITSENGWSSMQIVKTLCPPFTVSGATVQCTPVANYPLDVQVAITPTQEGTGDPSPENVRPIVGWDSVNVWRSGKNLLDWSKVSIYPSPAYGLSFEKKENSIRVFGTSTQSGGLSFNIATTTQSELYGKNFIFSWFTSEENVIKVYGLRTTSEDTIAIVANLTEGSSYDFTIQIAIGTEKLTSYEPYQGQTYAVQLGQTIYGGTVDAVTGEGVETWLYHLLTSSNTTTSMLEANSNETSVLFGISRINGELISNQYGGTESWVCSHLPYLAIVAASSIDNGIQGNRDDNMFYIRLNREIANDIQEFLGWLDAQSAAGTPVQVAYKLATPTAFQATGGQSIPALPGTNTVYTDAGNITVTGASDPIATITALQARVSALESAALN